MMSKMWQGLVVFSVVATLAASATTVHAVFVTADSVTVFDDTFEASPLGNIAGHTTAPGPGVWTQAGSGDSTHAVIGPSDPGPGAAEGDQYLQLTRVSGPTWAVAQQWTASSGTGAQMHAEWMTYLPSGLPNFGFIGGFSLDVDTDPATSVSVNNGTVMALNSANSAWDATTLSVVFDAWQKWELDWEVGSDTMLITLDGASFNYTGSGSLGTGMATAGYFFVAAGDNGATLYVDAVPIPEPSSFLLLIGGAASTLLLRRRRKRPLA